MPDAGRIEHAAADKAYVHWLMTRAAAGYDRHLARNQVATADKFAVDTEHNELLMARYKALDAFGDHGFCRVDELLHQALPRR